jgi:hypothetical protein
VPAWVLASNRYRVRPLLPTRALPGIPGRACSETVTAWLTGPVAAGLAGCEAGGEVAGLALEVLELLEQAAASRPIPATPAAPAIMRFTVTLPQCAPG